MFVHVPMSSSTSSAASAWRPWRSMLNNFHGYICCSKKTSWYIAAPARLTMRHVNARSACKSARPNSTGVFHKDPTADIDGRMWSPDVAATTG